MPGPKRWRTAGRVLLVQKGAVLRLGEKVSPVGRRWTRGQELKKEGLWRAPRRAKEVRFYPGVEEANNSSYKSISSAFRKLILASE